MQLHSAIGEAQSDWRQALRLLESTLHGAPRCELVAAEAGLRELLQDVVSRVGRATSSLDTQRVDDLAVADVINADLRLRGYQPLDRGNVGAEDETTPGGHSLGEEDMTLQDTIAEELRKRAAGQAAGEIEGDSVEAVPGSPERGGSLDEQGSRSCEGMPSSQESDEEEVDDASEDGDAPVFGAERVLVSIKASLAKGELPTAAELEGFFDVDALPDGEDMVAVDVYGLGPGFAEAPKEAAQAMIAKHGVAHAAKLIVSACEAMTANDEENAESDGEEASDASGTQDVQAGGEDSCERQGLE